MKNKKNRQKPQNSPRLLFKILSTPSPIKLIEQLISIEFRFTAVYANTSCAENERNKRNGQLPLPTLASTSRQNSCDCKLFFSFFLHHWHFLSD